MKPFVEISIFILIDHYIIMLKLTCEFMYKLNAMTVVEVIKPIKNVFVKLNTSLSALIQFTTSC